jgi:hypothetical protein
MRITNNLIKFMSPDENVDVPAVETPVEEAPVEETPAAEAEEDVPAAE